MKRGWRLPEPGGKAGKAFAEDFLHGEAYVESQLVEQFIKDLPITEIKSRYVLFKPLSEIDPANEQPETTVFVVDPDQLSALVILANYGREGMENVIIPWAAGCQTIGIYPYREARHRPGLLWG
jgi:uncharacterized protein (DUF169 family)